LLSRPSLALALVVTQTRRNKQTNEHAGGNMDKETFMDAVMAFFGFACFLFFYLMVA
jgi:hypothetical protein